MAKKTLHKLVMTIRTKTPCDRFTATMAARECLRGMECYPTSWGNPYHPDEFYISSIRER